MSGRPKNIYVTASSQPSCQSWTPSGLARVTGGLVTACLVQRQRQPHPDGRFWPRAAGLRSIDDITRRTRRAGRRPSTDGGPHAGGAPALRAGGRRRRGGAGRRGRADALVTPRQDEGDATPEATRAAGHLHITTMRRYPPLSSTVTSSSLLDVIEDLAGDGLGWPSCNRTHRRRIEFRGAIGGQQTI